MSGLYQIGQSLVVVVLLTCIIPAEAGTPTYILTDLGVLPGYDSSAALGVNDAGEVVGDSSFIYFDEYGNNAMDRVACLWSDGMVLGLGQPDGDNTVAEAINSSGIVVVHTDNSPTYVRSYVWDDGSLIPLGSLGASALALDINDAGTVVGWSTYVPPEGSPETHAFSWANGTTTSLGYIGSSTDAMAINNSGQIVIEHWLVDGEKWTDIGMRGDDINDFTQNQRFHADCRRGVRTYRVLARRGS